MKVGVIDVGGGFRAIFGCGILDHCLEMGVEFDYCMGISAGSGNVLSYMSGQKGRNAKYYLYYSQRKEYASMYNMLKKGSYADLDYIYGTLSNSDGECPFDYTAFVQSGKEFRSVAMDAQTGQAAYFDNEDIRQDCYDVCKVSSALPGAGKPYAMNGREYFDGGIVDPIPLKKAFADGCDYVVVILTRQLSTVRTPKRDRMPAKMIQRKYPLAANRLKMRYHTYNEEIQVAKKYAAEGKVLILAPDSLCGLDTLKRKKKDLERMYRKGWKAAEQIPVFLDQIQKQKA